MISKNISAALLLLGCTIAVLAGCHKHPASIVGVWSANSQRTVDQTSGVTTYDTTIKIQSGQITLVFNSDGTYSFELPSTTSYGNYTVNGSKLTLFRNDTLPGQTYQILSLTSNSLTYQSTDTISHNPVSTAQYTVYCSD